MVQVAVLPVFFQLVGVDVGPDSWHLTDADGARHDLQRLGQQVVRHVQVVGELPARREWPRMPPESDRGEAADLGVDLVAHRDVHAEALAQAEDCGLR